MDIVTLQLDGANPELTGALLRLTLGTIVAPSEWRAVGGGMPARFKRVAVCTTGKHVVSAYHTGARWVFHSRRQDYTITHWRPWEG